MRIPTKEMDVRLASRFFTGPSLVQDEDELYDRLEIHKGSSHKYFICLNPAHAVRGYDTVNFNPRVKLFRKFFIENAGMLQGNCTFLELKDKRLAEKIGITQEGQIYCFENPSILSSRSKNELSLFNLKLLRTDCGPNDLKVLAKEHIKKAGSAANLENYVY